MDQPTVLNQTRARAIFSNKRATISRPGRQFLMTGKGWKAVVHRSLNAIGYDPVRRSEPGSAPAPMLDEQFAAHLNLAETAIAGFSSSAE